MGWTWSGANSVELLNKYPSIAKLPEIVQRWPGLKDQLTGPQGSKLSVEVREALKVSMPDLKVPNSEQ